MRLFIKSIDIENITSYVSESIELPDNQKFVIINGRNEETQSINGSGKTSLVMSIMTQLGILSTYKHLRRIQQDDDSLVSLTLKGDDKQIKITRKFNKQKSVLNIESSDMNDIMFLRLKDNEEFLKQQLLIDEFYQLTHFFTSQNESIFDLSSSQIFNFIEKLFKIDELMKFNEIVKNKQKEIESQIEVEKKKIDTDEKILKELTQRLENIHKNLEQLNTNNNLDKLNKLLSEVNSGLQNIKLNPIVLENNVDFNQLNKQLQQLQKETDKRLNQIQEQINKLKGEEKSLKNSVSEYNKLKDLKVCPVCKQEIRNETKINYETKTNELLEQVVKIREQVNELEKQLSVEKNVLETIRNLQIKLHQLQQLYELVQTKQNLEQSLKDEIEKTNKRIQEIKNEIETLTKSVEQKQRDLTIYEFLNNVTKSKSELRQSYLYQFINNMRELYREFSYVFDDSDEFDMEFDLDKSQIVFGLRRNDILLPYKLLSNGERKKVSIIFVLTILKLINILSTDVLRIIVLDDFFHGLDQQNTYKILQQLHEFSETYDYQIILSNNNIEVVDFPTVTIDIVKKDGISYVENVKYRDFF